MPSRTRKYYVDDVEVRVATERVQYLDADGKLITESLKDYTRKTVRKAYASLDDFLNVWNDAERKQAILEELAAKGVFLDELAEQVGPRLRRLRSRLPRRLRPAAAHAPGAGREGARSATSSPSTATRPAPSSKPCSRNTPTAASPASSRWKSSRWTRSPPSAPGRNRQALRRQARLPRRHPRTRNRPLPESRLIHAQRLQPRQNHPGHHAQGRRHLRRRPAPRTARLDVLPQDLRRPREGDWNSSATTTGRRCPSTCAGPPGPRTTKASPATPCSTSSTTPSCPS